jgi:hypothetical protein
MKPMVVKPVENSQVNKTYPTLLDNGVDETGTQVRENLDRDTSDVSSNVSIASD